MIVRLNQPRINLTSIKIKSEAKNNKVDHSTRPKIPSMSSLSYKSSNSKAPRSAVQPKPKIPNTNLQKKSQTT